MPIDKNELYALFQHSFDRRERLADLATRKALDLPVEDEVNITNTTTHHGPSPLAMLAVSALMLLGGGGIALSAAGLAGWFQSPGGAAVQPSGPHEFRISFWTEEGSEIPVRRQDLKNKEQP